MDKNMWLQKRMELAILCVLALFSMGLTAPQAAQAPLKSFAELVKRPAPAW